MKDHIHYEAAFEGYLRASSIPYVAVDEGHRAAFRDARLKSFDFIVYSRQHRNWLVDVKGRGFGTHAAGRAPRWDNWVTQADLDGLATWQEVFGAGFGALFVFAFRIDCGPLPSTDIAYRFRNDAYVFAAITSDVYARHARVRSPRWGTVNLSRSEFLRQMRPIREML